MEVFILFGFLAIILYNTFLAYIILKIILKAIHLQHKKTRKEAQEIKTRLTQVRKDLNVIEVQNVIKRTKGSTKRNIKTGAASTNPLYTIIG